MKGIKNVIYLSLAVGLLIYAVPQLNMGQGFTPATIFAICWMVMILIIIAAHLHQLMGVDEETKQELARVKAYKRWRMEQFILGKKKVFPTRDS